MRTHSFITAALFASSAYAQLQAISEPGVNGAADTVLAKAGAVQAQAESGHQIVQARGVTTSIINLDLANPQSSNVDSTGVVAIAEELTLGISAVRMVEGKIPTTKRDVIGEIEADLGFLPVGTIPTLPEFIPTTKRDIINEVEGEIGIISIGTVPTLPDFVPTTKRDIISEVEGDIGIISVRTFPTLPNFVPTTKRDIISEVEADLGFVPEDTIPDLPAFVPTTKRDIINEVEGEIGIISVGSFPSLTEFVPTTKRDIISDVEGEIGIISVGSVPTLPEFVPTKRDASSDIEAEINELEADATLLLEGGVPDFPDFDKRASVGGAGAQVTDGGAALAGPDSGAADQVVATFDAITQEMQARGFLDGLNAEDTVAGYEGDVTSFAKRALPAVTSYQTILDELNSVIDMIHDAPVDQSQAEQAYGIIAKAICILGDILEALSTDDLATTFDNCDLTSTTSATTVPDFGQLKSIIDEYLASSTFATPLSTGTLSPTQVDVIQQLANELGDLLLQYYKGYLQAVNVPTSPVKRRSLTVGDYSLNTDEEALAQNALTQVSQKTAALGKRQDIVGTLDKFVKGSSLSTNLGGQDAALAAAQQAVANA